MSKVQVTGPTRNYTNPDSPDYVPKRFERSEPNTPTGQQLRPALEKVFAEDIETLILKDSQYQGSWKKRGGRGAYFTLVRPWDRFVNFVKDGELDMFSILQREMEDGRYMQDGTLSASIADVRRYLALVESEMLLRNQPAYASPRETPPKVEADNEYAHPYPTVAQISAYPKAAQERIDELEEKLERAESDCRHAQETP